MTKYEEYLLDTLTSHAKYYNFVNKEDKSSFRQVWDKTFRQFAKTLNYVSKKALESGVDVANTKYKDTIGNGKYNHCIVEHTTSIKLFLEESSKIENDDERREYIANYSGCALITREEDKLLKKSRHSWEWEQNYAENNIEIIKTNLTNRY